MKLLIIEKIKYIYFFIKWRNRNKNNGTKPVSIFPINIVHVGKGTYGRIDVETFGTKNSCLQIGNFCSIAKNVRFLLDGEHKYDSVSTFPFKVHYCNEECEAISKGPIIVEDDVWICENCMILSGVKIGQGAIVAAGSIVSKNVPPYAIYVNGEVKKYRFKNEIIDKLLLFDYNSLSSEDIRNNIDIIYSNIDEFVESDFYREHIKMPHK